MLRNLILYARMVPFAFGLVHNNKHRHSFNGPQINLFLPHILQGKNINFIFLLSTIFSHKTFPLITFFSLQRLTTGNFILFCLSLKDISLEYTYLCVRVVRAILVHRLLFYLLLILRLLIHEKFQHEIDVVTN